MGPSGGGKTTLCSLIPRFYDPTEGHIRLDGRDLRQITLESLRSQVGIVQQDVYLFSGTVYDNIAYGKPGASREEVMAAAKMAGADEFIEGLKDGYDTYVGERGVKLSGGQKQRLSIARVFLKNPPILVLDEATSALDNESEKHCPPVKYDPECRPDSGSFRQPDCGRGKSRGIDETKGNLLPFNDVCRVRFGFRRRPCRIAGGN